MIPGPTHRVTQTRAAAHSLQGMAANNVGGALTSQAAM